MQEWFEALTSFEKIFWYIAVPFSLIFIIQLVLTIAGLDGRKNNTSSAMENAPKNKTILTIGRSFFSLRNIIMFLMIFGWMGVIAYNIGMTQAISFLIALASGFFAMILVAFLFYFSHKTNRS